MNTKNIVLGVFVVILVATGALLLRKPIVIEKSAPVPAVGAFSGPDIPWPYISVGGVPFYSARTTLTQGASTTCSIQSPASTSTLLFGGVKFDVASTSGTLLVEMGRSINQYSTTTAIGGSNSLVAGLKATLMASTTSGNEQALVFPPNHYFNIKIGGLAAKQVPEGTCQATFMAF
jgi:hypothetical protein